MEKNSMEIYTFNKTVLNSIVVVNLYLSEWGDNVNSFQYITQPCIRGQIIEKYSYSFSSCYKCQHFSS